jgi:hypothetical protein
MTQTTQLGRLVKPGQLYEVDADGTWRFFFDSSMIRSFRECPQLFKYKYVDNIRGRGNHFKTAVGSWWSSTMELYYNAFRAKDLTRTSAVEFALHEWNEHKMQQTFAVNWPDSYNKFGGQLGAAEMASEYWDWAHTLDERSWDVVSVEEGSGRLREIFIGKMENIHGVKVEVYYIIKPDLYVIENNVLMPVDHKTKDYLKSGMQHEFKPHFQTMGYIIAAQELSNDLKLGLQPDRCLINVAARNKPGPAAKVQERFRRFPISYSVSQLAEWREKVLATAIELRQCFESGIWSWTESTCHKFGGCTYRALDSVPADARLTVIKAAYDIGESWVPYKTIKDEDDA